MEILISIVLIGLMILWVIRFALQMADVKAGQSSNAFIKWISKEKIEYQGEKVMWKELCGVFLLALLFRLVIYVFSAVYFCMHSENTACTIMDVLSLWNRWDSPHYLELAELGYENCIENGEHLFLVFLPLYPWLIRLFHVVIANWEIAALVISVLSYAIGCVFFYAVIAMEYSKEIAYKSIVLLSVFPFAFFFGSIMTESVFFLTMAMGFYFVKKHNWLLVGIVGIFCALSRIQGVIILGVAGVEFLQTYPIGKYIREKCVGKFFKEVFTKGIFLLLIPIGNVIYFWLNYQVEGDPFYFQIPQEHHWYHKTVFFTKCLKEIIENITNEGTSLTMKMSIWLPELVIFVLTVVLLFYGLRRHQMKYMAYLFVYTLINYSITFLISGGRYMLLALPLFIIGGEWADRHPKAYPFLVSVSAMLMIIYMIGYFEWKQIM